MTTAKRGGKGAALKQGRRRNGEGAITHDRELPDGTRVIRWRISATRPDGTYERRNGTTYGTLAEARRAMREARAQIELVTDSTENADMTVSALMDDFLKVRGPHLRQRTSDNYAALVRLHIVPAIGSVKVRQLDAGTLNRWHLTLAAGEAEGAPLGRTRQLIHGVVRQALDHGVILGILEHNPARSVRVPPPPPPRRLRLEDEGQVMAFSPSQAEYLHELALAEDDPHAYGIALALALGLRRGEVYGLRLSDIDLTARWDAPDGLLHVRQIMTTSGAHDRIGPPKTRRSRRTLRLNPRARQAIDAAIAWQARQGISEMAERLLICQLDGQPQRPGRSRATMDRLQRRLHAAIREAGGEVPPILSYHACRSTFVSCAYAAGATIADISRVCGHVSVFVTETIYKHVFDKAAPLVRYSRTPTDGAPVIKL